MNLSWWIYRQLIDIYILSSFALYFWSLVNKGAWHSFWRGWIIVNRCCVVDIIIIGFISSFNDFNLFIWGLRLWFYMWLFDGLLADVWLLEVSSVNKFILKGIKCIIDSKSTGNHADLFLIFLDELSLVLFKTI